jgi:hypothetical protein
MASNASTLASFATGIGTQGAVLQVDNATQTIGIGTDNPQAMLQVGTSITMEGNLGIITATTFSGDATGLSGSPDIIVGTITASGSVSVGGTLTYEDVTNVDAVGLITARSGINIGSPGIAATLTADGGAIYSGIVTASSYRGDGSQLTGISVGLTTEAITVSSGTGTLNLTDAQDHKVTATGICTITTTGGTEADSHTVRIINSGIATVGFSTYFLFPSGATPTLPTADGAISLISFTVNRVGAAGTQLLSGASVNYS